MSESETKEQITRRAVFTASVVEQVRDVRFVNIGTADEPQCVSAPVSDEVMDRWLQIPGFEEYRGPTDEVDEKLAARVVQAAQAADERAVTIASLEDSNRRLSTDLVAARQKIMQLVQGDQTGAQQKIADLADELRGAHERIANLEAGVGKDTAAANRIETLETQLADMTAKAEALEEQLTAPADGMPLIAPEAVDQAILAEIQRIAELPHGFKKELEALVARLSGAADDEN